jgi:hypothetical protein
MNVSQLVAIGAVMVSVGSAAAGSSVASSSDERRAPAPCLVGTAQCSVKNDPPKVCPVYAKSGKQCPMDGFEVIEADSH